MILLMANLAIAQPLFDLLGRQAEFLVAHAIGPTGLISLAVFLSIAVPGLLALVPLLAKRIGKLPGEFAFYLLFGLLTALTITPVLISAAWSGIPVLLAAGLIAAALLFIYHAVANVRLFFKYLAPAILIFPLIFLFFSRATPLLLAEVRDLDSTQSSLQSTPDIVFLVLDEFPLVSLLTSDLQIDRERFPNFARLAARSVSPSSCGINSSAS